MVVEDGRRRQSVRLRGSTLVRALAAGWWLGIAGCGDTGPASPEPSDAPTLHLSVRSHHDVWAQLRGSDAPTSLLTSASGSSTDLFFSTEPASSEASEPGEPEVELIGRLESAGGKVELDARLELAHPTSIEVTGLEESVLTLDGETRSSQSVPPGSYRLQVSGRWR